MTNGDGSPSLSATLGAKVLKTMTALADGRERHALLDFPSHWNIGDSAIWLGEATLLRQLHARRPAYVSHLKYPIGKVGRHLPADGLIYLHGGGNFGDIWPRYQRYRDAVIACYPDHRIVQLPQSLHFSDPATIESTKRVIGHHRDFHLMVRDRKSLDFAVKHFDCPAILVPDSAFGISMASFPRHPAPEGIGGIFRTDKERRHDADKAMGLFGATANEDWQKKGDLRQKAEKGVLGALMVMPQRLAPGLASRSFDVMARARVAMGFAQIDRHAVLVTDRLHGHIMATLLGKPHVVIDNFYGKIANFIDAFGMDDVTLRAESFSEAREMADQLLARQGATVGPASTNSTSTER